MARSEPFVELLKELRTAPWWVSIAFGVCLYLGIAEGIPLVVGADSVAARVTQPYSWLALLFLVPASISVYLKLRGRLLLANHRTLEAIRKLDWQEFEELIQAYYRSQGFRTERQLDPGADGGVDVRFKNAQGERYLVQCKHWRTRKVGVNVLHELHSVVTMERATRGIVIISGEFTRAAHTLARRFPSISSTANSYVKCCRTNYRRPTHLTRLNASKRRRREPVLAAAASLCSGLADAAEPPEPKFYGCSSYPDCRYTENIP